MEQMRVMLAMVKSEFAGVIAEMTRSREQVLKNQLALMERFNAGWTEEGAVVLQKRIAETRTLLAAKYAGE